MADCISPVVLAGVQEMRMHRWGIRAIPDLTTLAVVTVFQLTRSGA